VSASGISLGALGSAGGSSITFSGLGSGLDTSSIVKALMEADREPVVHLTQEQAKLGSQQGVLGGIESSLQQLSFAVAEFGLPSLFESSQSVTSSEPLRVSAVASSGAGVGGYEVEVKQLANSAQRTFTFASPAAEDTVTVDGQEFALKAGESAKEFASTINSSSTATVFAAALENGTVVLSSRATGNTGAGFIEVADAGGVLSEVAGTEKEGKDAEFSVDGVLGTSSSNTVTTGIAGVSLTLEGLTPTGPVTIDVQPPAPSVSKIEGQVQSFIKLYNSTVEAIEKQVTTKPPKGANEAGVGSFFADGELTGLLASMRDAMYEPVTGLPAEMSSPLDVGISTGAPTGGASSQASLEGLLKLEPAKLAEAIASNAGGVSTMLEQWSHGLERMINSASGPGGALATRISDEGEQAAQLNSQIANMNEMLAVREKGLLATFAAMESIISENNAQGASLTKQSEALASQKL
jgi:flagellar hook-associated protein 2